MELELSNGKIFSSIKHPDTKEEIFSIKDVDGDVVYLTKEDIKQIIKIVGDKPSLDLDRIKKFVDDIKKTPGNKFPNIDPLSPIGDFPTVPNTRPTFWYATYKYK